MHNTLKAFIAASASLILLAGCTTPSIQEADNTPSTPKPDADDIALDSTYADFPSLAGIKPGENINEAPDFTYTTLEEFYSQTTDWFDCSTTIQCDRVYVPKDWNNPDAGMMYIATVRLPATGESRGSILVNPGGPGASGIELLFYAAESITTANLREHYDLIGFDPRGVGYSDSVYCGPGEVLDVVFLDTGAKPDLDGPGGIRDGEQRYDYIAQACSKGTGDILGYLDTISAAKDMDLIRATLGEDHLNYLGFSYGTQLGATYAALFPDKVGKFILDGAINPTLTPEESTLRQAAGFELAFNNYLDDCLLRSTCPVPGGDRDTIKENLKEFLREVETTPLETSLDNELGIWPAITGIVSNLYSKASWNTLSSDLRNAYEDKDGTGLLNSAYNYMERGSDGEYWGTISISNIAINCLDDNYSTDPAVVAATNAAVADLAPLFGRYWTNSYIACKNWPHESPHLDVTLDFTLELANPILVIGTTGDPATPYENAVDLAEMLNPGYLLTYDGEGHTVYANRSECVDAYVDGYVLEGILSDEPVICK